MDWILLSLIALTSFSVMVTLITFSVKKGIPLSLVLFGIFAVGAICYFSQLVVGPKISVNISPSILLLLVVMGLLSFVGNWAQFQATTNAPNAGLVIGIVNLQAALITTLAFVFFKDKITPIQVFGIFMTIIGALIISSGAAKTDKEKSSNQKIFISQSK